jgi:adenosylcobinamide kinase / adenosylcobinamide-phosphate guanylyltransferase
MQKSLTLILGGARSGKSTHAETLAAQASRVLYVATAEAWDDDMRARIAAHQAERPATWQTLEAPRRAGAAIAAREQEQPFDVILVDCLTLLASNAILAQPEPVESAAANAAVQQELDGLLHAHTQSNAAWIIVSNEVGLGIVPAYPLGRIYRDALGRANQRLAATAGRVLFMVAGLPMQVK